ncbi:hypothetical protein B1218_32495 [Pseudomonas ogarae]|nr:hypothetical protein B1218_32495 [Pseudomonas ogarae]
MSSITYARLTPPPLSGLLTFFTAWSLLAHPVEAAGGIPGQPDPDSPNEQPTEPGEPTLPDEPPPAPVA